MDRQIVYPGQILPETTLLQMAKDAMIGSAKLTAAMLGTSTIANGFAVSPTGPASLQVVVAPGEIYSLTSIDALAFSSLPADTTHSIVKQGILLDGVTLSCPAPGTTGQSINYLIQATYQDLDSAPVLLPYYNSANPAMPFSGMGNNGLTQNTMRKGVAIVQVKAGASAATGSQVTPAPDAGYVGLYVVSVAFGQTTITSGNISQYSGAPLLPGGLLQAIQAGQTTSGTDIGTANAYAANFTPAITSVSDKMVLCIKAANVNTGASTFTPAPGVIAPAPIVGGAHSALQGFEIAANGDVWLQWNSSIGSGSWILLDSTGGGMQVAGASKSMHAMQLGQFSSQAIAYGTIKTVKRQIITSTSTYTPTAGMVFVEVEVIGGGGGGGSAFGAAGNVSGGSGGSGGGYSKKLFTAAQIGASAAIVNGTGGAGGAAGQNIGSPGGNTTFTPAGTGGVITAFGGNGGYFGSTSTGVDCNTNGIGGQTSLPTGGDINIRGQQGGWGLLFGGTARAIGGRGGDSPYGRGGQEPQQGNPGNSGTGLGAGGAGGAATTVSQAGGTGQAGGVVITEYCVQ
ncbi:hypothetical protein A9978_19060 [Pseudomonas sp. UMC65]|uniref:glycine-rich domain-containing protein n=1 Tax=Pseudomonas sp. UMC65 TaxID=1862323 RepID=UPI0016043780|nr:phage tail protein [Pseudomonas sp. UMC65]MBB1614540.1 hypothetical protein [Pseudomonas sp. UMC65]